MRLSKTPVSLLAAGLCIGVAVFLGIWALKEIRFLDEWGLRFAERVAENPFWFGFARWTTRVGDTVTIILVTLCMLGYRYFSGTQYRGKNRVAYASLAILDSLGVWGISAVLKHAISRERPNIAHGVSVSTTSFPSGHSMVAMGVYPIVGYWLGRGHKQQKAFICIGVLLALLVGLSRVMLGVHYVSDVLAGWALGGAWSILWIYIEERWKKGNALRLKGGMQR